MGKNNKQKKKEKALQDTSDPDQLKVSPRSKINRV